MDRIPGADFIEHPAHEAELNSATT